MIFLFIYLFTVHSSTFALNFPYSFSFPLGDFRRLLALHSNAAYLNT